MRVGIYRHAWLNEAKFLNAHLSNWFHSCMQHTKKACPFARIMLGIATGSNVSLSIACLHTFVASMCAARESTTNISKPGTLLPMFVSLTG